MLPNTFIESEIRGSVLRRDHDRDSFRPKRFQNPQLNAKGACTPHGRTRSRQAGS